MASAIGLVAISLMGSALIAEQILMGSLKFVAGTTSRSNPALTPSIPKRLRRWFAIDCLPRGWEIFSINEVNNLPGAKSKYKVAVPDEAISSRKGADSA